MEARSRAARHADYVQEGRNYESAADRLADRMEIMAGIEVDVEDASLPPRPRCQRVLCYADATDMPRGPKYVGQVFSVPTVEVQCERTAGHRGNCIGRTSDGQSFAAPGS